MKGRHPPRRVYVLGHNHSESAFASDTLSTSEETYSEESLDDVIKSSRDTPPKAKQATVLETWLQVNFVSYWLHEGAACLSSVSRSSMSMLLHVRRGNAACTIQTSPSTFLYFVKVDSKIIHSDLTS